MSQEKSIFERLAEPFSIKDLQFRVVRTSTDQKRGKVLPFIDARAIMERLDEVVGPENWQDTYTMEQNGVMCSLSLRIEGQWVVKSDGSGYTEVDPVKGGVSDALKRAAVKWGIGRYLYHLDQIWAPLKPGSTKYLASDPVLPDWALPEAERTGKTTQDIPPAEELDLGDAPKQEEVPAADVKPEAPQSAPEKEAELPELSADNPPEGIEAADVARVRKVLKKITDEGVDPARARSYLESNVSELASKWGSQLISKLPSIV